jgi:N-carbamoyl-L-amino-acid hydrolase
MNGYPTERLIHAIQSQRLWDALMAMAALGATPRGGVKRLALDAQDHAARQHLARWARAHGYRVWRDPIGNVFVRREGRDPHAPPVLTGSHLDSQPTGGKFDGPVGVLAGLELLQALDDAGLSTQRPIEVVSWANEEGCRFPPGCMGSSCFATPSLAADWRCRTDRDGITVAQALGALDTLLTDVPVRPLGQPVHAYVEVHIEQGPVLENHQATIGVVSGIQGCRDWTVTVRGREGHAGTTPLAVRSDALRCAVALLERLYRLAERSGPEMRLTVGELHVAPNSSSVIPGEVRFAIDFRHPLQTALTSIGDQIEAVCRTHRSACTVELTPVRWREPVVFDAALQRRIDDAARRQGHAAMTLVSGAAHDAVHLHRVCPSGMVFVPCAGGISHSEDERAQASDLHAGAQVLAEVVFGLAND